MIDDIKADEESFTAGRIIYYILGIIEVLLTFRFIFKLLGANPNSGFVSLIYSISQVFTTENKQKRNRKEIVKS